MVLSEIDPNLVNGRAPPRHTRQAMRARTQAQFESQNQTPTQGLNGLLDASIAAMYMTPLPPPTTAPGRPPVAPFSGIPGSHQAIRPHDLLSTSSGRLPLPTPTEDPLGISLSDLVPQDSSDRRPPAEHGTRDGARAPTPNGTLAPYAVYLPESESEFFSSRIETAAGLEEARRLVAIVESDEQYWGPAEAWRGEVERTVHREFMVERRNRAGEREGVENGARERGEEENLPFPQAVVGMEREMLGERRTDQLRRRLAVLDGRTSNLGSTSATLRSVDKESPASKSRLPR